MDWSKLHEEEREGFRLIVETSPEWENPRDHFDCFDTKQQAEEFFRKIETGFYDWFGFRVRAFKHGVLLGEASLWGCCYENAREILTDGTFEDIAFEAMKEAKETIRRIVEGEEVTA